MRPGEDPATILLVDDDEVLRHVLKRVLTGEGYNVLNASGVGEALQIATQNAPDLALLDFSLQDGDGVALASKLRAQQGGLPLILMTGYPLRLRERPELADSFRRILTKPIDLGDFRRTVRAVLVEETMKSRTANSPSVPELSEPRTIQQAGPDGPAAAAPKGARFTWWKRIAIVAAAAVVLAGLILLLAGVPLPWQASGQERSTSPSPPLKVMLVEDKDRPHTLLVPEDVQKSLGILKGKVEAVAAAQAPTNLRPLVLSGSTALDPATLTRIRIRFTPAEVVKIGETEERAPGPTKYRELHSGDAVAKDQLLAVVYSVDVGSKKNDLVDALVQLRLDEEVFAKAENSSQVVPEVFLLNARRAVEADRNAEARALNTLKTWGISEPDIKAVYEEAKEIGKRGGKRDAAKQDQWARVELKAPASGTIVERNVAVHETIVDNTLNLFQIAKLERLLVIGYAPEDSLPDLLRLGTEQRRWTIHTVGSPSEGISGAIDEISSLIDVNQHTAVVKGFIDNPEGRIRAGQFATAAIKLLPPENVVEIPMKALVDDGSQCFVFVQSDPTKPEFTLRRVEVTHRFDDSAYVQSAWPGKKPTLTPDEKALGLMPLEPLHEGDRVLTAGALVLKKELQDKESDADKGLLRPEH